MRPTRRAFLIQCGLGGLAGLLSPRSIPAMGRPTSTQAADPAARRRELYGLLGDLPGRDRPISATKRTEEIHPDGYVLESWDLDLNGIERVPAFLVRPRDPSGRRPAVLFNHSHGGGYTIGKLELINGRNYLQEPPYAKVLTDLGFVGLCIDHWVFGERAHTSEMDTFKAMLWQGRVLWGMMVYDSVRALDWLAGRPEVDPARIGTLGISMGSTMAWWLAALDERVRVTVDLCCLTDFDTLLKTHGLGGHGIYYYVPGLLKHFSTAQINALIAPRAHLGLAGNLDPLTPTEGLDIIDRELRDVYAAAGYPQRWKLLRFDTGHRETPEGRAAIIEFLKTHLEKNC